MEIKASFVTPSGAPTSLTRVPECPPVRSGDYAAYDLDSNIIIDLLEHHEYMGDISINKYRMIISGSSVADTKEKAIRLLKKRVWYMVYEIEING